jgi:hypothetical protein
MLRFFRDTQKSSLSTLMVFDSLGIFSFLPILKMYKNNGSIKIYYRHANSFGLIIIRILTFFGVVLVDSCRIKDFLILDSQNTRLHRACFYAYHLCHPQLKKIEETIVTFFPGLSKYSTDLLVMGVKNSWMQCLTEIIYLQAFAEQTAKELNISPDRVVVVSCYASLMKELKSVLPFSIPSSSIPIIQQLFRNRTILYLGQNLKLCLRDAFIRLLCIPKKIKDHLPKVSFTAIWGINTESRRSMMDDLFWWRSSGICSERLVYFYDRADFQPTAEKLEVTDSMGIKSVLSGASFSDNFSQLSLDRIVQKSFWVSLLEVLQVLKWSFRSLFLEPLPRSVLAIGMYHWVGATKLADYFRSQNVKGLIHYQSTGADKHSLAAEFTDACRFSFFWSCLHNLCDILATSQVFFVWGSNDGRVQTDLGCISKHLLIAGCLVDKPSEEQNQKISLAAADQVRERGATYLLALLPSSSLSKQFYTFFLNWLVEDPDLGLLVKTKGSMWPVIQADGLNGLVQRALKTGRIQIIDPTVSPVEVAGVSDFSIGLGTYSAVVVSALSGARVIFLDFERMDQQGQFNQPYFILHSLGPNRCVFYDFDSVKQAILEYINNPESNPALGDISSVLDLFDPFQDGKAKQRIGEYIGWYMEGSDNGFSRDDALCQATQKYAEKWGEDKVIRGLLKPEQLSLLKK